MIRINLLPPEYLELQAKREQQILIGSGAGILILIFFGFLGLKFFQASTLDRKITEAKSELEKYKAILAQIEDIKNKNKKLTAKRDVIKSLNRSRLVYPVFFEDLLPIIPADVWLRNISIKEKGMGSYNVTLESQALSNFALATWLTNFEQSKHFSKVEFGNINYAKQMADRPPILSFQIQCDYQHKGPYPLEEYY